MKEGVKLKLELSDFFYELTVILIPRKYNF